MAEPVSPLLLVTIVDEYPLAVAGLRTLLGDHPDIGMVEPEDALRRSAELDVVLYEPIGLGALSRARLRELTTGQAAPTMVEFSWSDAAHRPGRRGPRLSKQAGVDELVDLLVEVAAERRRLLATPRRRLVARSVFDVLDHDPELRRIGLSRREVEVLALITQGYSNEEITRQLYLSINSIKTYVRGAYAKIQVDRRAQAVAWGMRHGLDTLLQTASDSTSRRDDAQPPA
ncbi:helix-turn-helix transcriptional regulator [Nocardioides alkalitolerans]|uniref:helix-turn-helix transcriptional regulator n=1 Tax=Nocardioides alkalitolerans TaxID=281714 RepID=UPI001FE14AF7|nr:response regulator transcription factor [Nocardioides alkalitolerans]